MDSFNYCYNYILFFCISVISILNTKFRTTLAECKQLNSTGLLARVGSTNITADKILYNHAIQMVSLYFLNFISIIVNSFNFSVSVSSFG